MSRLVRNVLAVYQPITPTGFTAPWRNGVTLVMRIAPGIAGTVLLEREVTSVDPTLTVVAVKRMAPEVEQAGRRSRVDHNSAGSGVLGALRATASSM